MAWYRCGGGAGLPASLKTGMNNVLNKKFGTVSQDYPPNGWPDDVNLLGLLEEKTQASASVCAFDDGADDVPTKSLVVTIPPTLSGVSNVTETQSGRNLLLLTDGTYTIGNTGATATILNGEISATGTTINSGGRTTRLSDYFILHAGTYYLSPVITASPYVRSYLNKKSDNTVVSYSSGYSFTVNEDIEVYFGINVEGGYTYDATIKPQLEFGSTAHDYEPYEAPTVYTASLGRTIYGGEVDIVNGQGTSTHAKITDFSTLRANGTSSTGAYRYIIDVSGMGDYYVGACVSNLLAYRVSYNANVGEFYNTSNVLIIFLAQDNESDAIAYLQSNSCEIAYPLSTPTYFSFDGQEIPTRLGYNAFWSEQGDTEVTYRGQGTLTPVLPTLISKSITENGTYNASDDSADGYSSVTVNVSGGSCERLLYLHCVNNDQIEIPAASSITQGAKYSQYVSYDSTTKKFTVLQDFTAIIIAWVYTYQTYESSRSDGAIYINNAQVAQYEASGTAAGSTGGVYLARNFKQNDTFNVYTPTRDGYPQQNLKIYILAAVPDNIYTFTDENA